MAKKKSFFSLSEIEPMDDMLLVQIPKPINSSNGVIIADSSISKEMAKNKGCVVLKVGSAWGTLFPKESGYTEIKEGDSLALSGDIMAFTIPDFDYDNNVAFIYRSDIRCKLNIKPESKIIS